MLIFLTSPPKVWRDRARTIKSFWQAGVNRMYHFPSWARSSEMNIAWQRCSIIHFQWTDDLDQWTIWFGLIVQNVVMTLGLLPSPRCLIACPAVPLRERAFQPFIFLSLHLISSQFILVSWSSLKILWILFVFLSYFIFFHFSLSDIIIVRIRSQALRWTMGWMDSYHRSKVF